MSSSTYTDDEADEAPRAPSHKTAYRARSVSPDPVLEKARLQHRSRIEKRQREDSARRQEEEAARQLAEQEEEEEEVIPQIDAAEEARQRWLKRQRNMERERRDAVWAEETLRDVWAPVTDPFTAMMDDLRAPEEPADARENCFGCAFVDTAEGGVYADDWERLLTALEHGLDNCNSLRPIATELQLIFAHTVRERMLSGGENPDEVDARAAWSPYGIITHFLEHTNSERLRSHVDVFRARLLCDTIYQNEVFQVNTLTGRVRVDAKALSKYSRAKDAEIKVRKSHVKRPTAAPLTLVSRTRPLYDASHESDPVFSRWAM